jgi:hypothetical protein
MYSIKQHNLQQLRDLREVFAKQAEEAKRDARALEQRKAKLRQQQVKESMQEWETIKSESTQLRMFR